MKWITTDLTNILNYWEEPLWLLAFLLIIPLLRIGKESPIKPQIRQRSGLPERTNTITGRKKPSTLQRLTYLRILAVIITILALAGTSIPVPTNRHHLAVLIDVSDSITPAEREKARRAILTVLGKMKPCDTIDLMIFAAIPRVLAQGLTPGEAEVLMESISLYSDQSQNTNLESALLVTKELFKDSQGNKGIFLLSDGRPNAGETSIDFWAKSSYVGARNDIPIYTIPLGKTGNNLVSLGLDFPETVRPGENTLLDWNVFSEYEQKVIATLKINGSEIRTQNINLLPGRSSIPLAIKAPHFGVHRVELEISDVKRIPISHATCGGVLRVGGPARILVVDEAKEVSPLTMALKVQGMEVQEVGVEKLPESLSGLTSYSAVVLDNVPALYITGPQEEALEGFVTGGGGLLVMGGDSSLGRGEYYASNIEDMLPVQTDTRQRLLFTRVKILFVIDQSGSMAEKVGNVSKEEAAIKGIASSLKELNLLDEVGILAFSDQPNWVLPFTPASKQDIINQALSRTGKGGGTDMASALGEAVEGLSGTGPLRRHVVILSDGYTMVGNIEELCRRLQGMGVTITTIGVGKKINQELLKSISKWGDGKYYRAKQEQIPQVIMKETIRVSRDLIQEGIFEPVIREEADFLTGLGAIAPVKGYLVTKPKGMATIYLEVGNKEKDPLLAGWRYGNGQVAVFTSDSGKRWLEPWFGSMPYGQFWGQLMRSIMKSRVDTGLHLTTRNEGGAVRLLVDATGPDRRLRTGLQLVGRMGNDSQQMFNLKETFPGRYEAILPVAGRGIQEFEVGELQGKSWTVGAVWLPPSDEYQSYGPDRTVLSYLSSITGGKMLFENEMEIPSTWSWKPYPLRRWLVIIALFILLIELAYRSTSLGQVTMAKTAISTWWRKQQQVLGSLRGSSETDDSTDVDGVKTMTAYRYLAEKNKPQVREGRHLDN